MGDFESHFWLHLDPRYDSDFYLEKVTGNESNMLLAYGEADQRQTLIKGLELGRRDW